MKRFILAALIAFFAALALAHLSAQEPSQSAAPAAAVKELFAQLKLDAIAAKDPEEPGRYVAALNIPDSQLLVISAPFAVPAAMDKLIADGKYMDAYQSLQSVVSHKGHFFVVDMLNDGLKRVNDPDQAFDSVTVDGGTPIQFDGKFPGQKLTEADYNAKFKADDERYARILKILATELRKKTTNE
jgi:hypothetical protein